MQFEDFRYFVKREIFDYQLFASFFCNLKKPGDKIATLVKQGKVIRIRKGLYVFGDKWRRSLLDLGVIANLLYGPSCVSAEYALTRYGLLAERAYTITMLTIGDNKVYETPLGNFEYRAIDAEKFKIGIEYRDVGKEGYFIASREKALADFVYQTPGILTHEQLHFFLFDEMRIDESMFRTFDFQLLKEIGKVYKKKSVQMLGEL